jgi:hypothetical protein
MYIDKSNLDNKLKIYNKDLNSKTTRLDFIFFYQNLAT